MVRSLFLGFSGALLAKRPLLTLGLIVVLLGSLVAPLGQMPAQATLNPPAVTSQPASQAPDQFRSYYLRASAQRSSLVSDSGKKGPISGASQPGRDELGPTLEKMVAQGQVRTYAFDENERAYWAELTDSGRDILAANSLISSIEPTSNPAPSQTQAQDNQTPAYPVGEKIGIQDFSPGVSSFVAVQVYTPFIWGLAQSGGLTVTLTLEDSLGVLKGVATQTYNAPPNNYVKIYNNLLYFETLFVQPSNPAKVPVTILPGDKVHAITAGIDPNDGIYKTEDKRLTVDDIKAWTSYMRDTVSGWTSAANSPVKITKSSSLSLSGYITPGSGLTYAEVTAGSDGNFSAPRFRTTSNSTYNVVNFDQGDTGFVRVVHTDYEVYTVHGHHVRVFENSGIVHGYADWLPYTLVSAVDVPHPNPYVSITLKDHFGGVKDSISGTVSGSYAVTLGALIRAGDTVEVAIGGEPPIQVAVSPLTARIDLATNQVVGSAPAGALMRLGAGRIDGYVKSNSSYQYMEKWITSDGGGNFASGAVQCGTNKYLNLQPGSFGFAGFEDAHGHFIYTTFAATANSVTPDFPIVEGWVKDLDVRPNITVRDSGGTIKYQTIVSPGLSVTSRPWIFDYTYYVLLAPQYTAPGDVVTVVSGDQTYTIPVDRITAYVDTDSNVVDGQAPAGATVRVVPDKDRTAYREVAADGSGNYVASNPFSYFNSNGCSTGNRNEDFVPGDYGRAIIRHTDGSEVYTTFGRGMHINENEVGLQLYEFVWNGLDYWGTPPARPPVVILNRQGTTWTGTVYTHGSANGNGLTDVSFPTIIRPGDAITATFDEGPIGNMRPARLSIDSIPRITGTPDTDTDTVRGLGPRGWGGLTSLNNPRSYTWIPPSTYTAYSPLQFISYSKVVDLQIGYTGWTSFSDTKGNRVWVAWSATDSPVKIIGWLKPGDTRVCGTAPPNQTVTIHDVTSETQDILIGTGSSDGSGRFCVDVSPPLYQGQVVIAESNGTLSQPVVVVLYQIFLPAILKN